MANFIRNIPATALYISTLTIGEITKGIAMLPNKSTKKQQLQLWLNTEFLKFFHGRILNIDQDIATAWGQLSATVKRPLPAIDSLIAATAYRNNLHLVTRNVKDFADLPISIINPFVARFAK